MFDSYLNILLDYTEFSTFYTFILLFPFYIFSFSLEKNYEIKIFTIKSIKNNSMGTLKIEKIKSADYKNRMISFKSGI